MAGPLPAWHRRIKEPGKYCRKIERSLKMKYTAEHPQKLIELMSAGYLNLEIAAKFGITEGVFYKWKELYPEFKAAYDIGYPKAFLWWMNQGREKYLEGGSDKGYKYWHAVMRNCFGYDLPESKGTTNININNMAVLESKSDSELMALLTKKLTKLRITGPEVIEAQVLEEKPDEQG